MALTRLAQDAVGVGLRHPHYDAALSHSDGLDFVEVHAENIAPTGGLYAEFIEHLKQTYLVSIHGTSLGLGSVHQAPANVLDTFANTVNKTNAVLVSEHICFNRTKIHGQLVHTGDLLPILYTHESLAWLSQQISDLQVLLGRQVLLENLSAYVPGLEHELSECEFLTELVRHSRCGLLLDLNNILVNLHNFNEEANSIQRIDLALSFIAQLPHESIGEIHLAGFTPHKQFGFYIDDHAQPISNEGWQLYRETLQMIGPKPTLIEWDNTLPTWSVLREEADKAKHIQTQLIHNGKSLV